MSKVEVQFLGIGAVRLRHEQTMIYIDSFSELVKPSSVENADLILFTHVDGDHFESQATARAAIQTGAVVMGPPSIAYPLLAHTSLPAQQLQVIYPIHFKKPVVCQVSGIKLKVYQTRHFNDWEPDHISYLIELGGRKFYITGDSSMMDETDEELKQLDGLIYSFVMDSSTPEAVEAHVIAIEKVQQVFGPRCFLPNHLINCEWTISPSILREAVKRKRLKGIEIIEDAGCAIEIG